MNCHIVRDLLPLYHDDVVSEETRELVKEHLDTCSECEKMLRDIHEGIGPGVGTTAGLETEQPLAKSLRSLKRRLRRKTVVSVVVSIFCALVMVSALTYGVFFYETLTPYAKVKQDMTKPINSPADFMLQTGRHNSVLLVLKDDALYVSYLDTAWTRFFARPDYPQNLSLIDADVSDPAGPYVLFIYVEPAEPVLSSPGPIGPPTVVFEPPEPPFQDPDAPVPADFFTLMNSATKVYYIEADLSKVASNELAFYCAAGNAVLIWEK
ncbi:MAG: zf-HC2 domain-containing protein [Coriobacteriia bacterium]|nr:zf-HC2 domain-containing protein [Coriobacteriia bacterium]